MDRTASRLLIQGAALTTTLHRTLDVKLYQAGVPFFPIRFRDDVDPYRHWGTDNAFSPPIPDPNLARTSHRRNYTQLTPEPESPYEI